MGRRWHTNVEGTEAWHGAWHFGRWQFGYHVYRHYSHLPDRWVFQPWFIVDRKRRTPTVRATSSGDDE